MEQTNFENRKCKEDFLQDKVDNFYWYVLFVSNGHEFDIATSIENILEKSSKRDYLKEIFIPVEIVQVLKNKTFVKRAQCIYSGYIFLLMKLDPLLIDQISDLRYVFRFLFSCSESVWPYILSDIEIRKIRESVHESEECKNKQHEHDYQVDDKVKITSGLFINMNADIIKIKNNIATVAVFPFETSTRSIKTDVKVSDLIFISRKNIGVMR